jgi:predicted heme/steroid binding protein
MPTNEIKPERVEKRDIHAEQTVVATLVTLQLRIQTLESHFFNLITRSSQMSRLFLTMALLASICSTVLHAQGALKAKDKARSNNSFELFNENASSLNKTNAYLLSYLTYMIYPQNLDSQVGEIEDALQKSNTLFELQYSNRLKHLFTNPKFKFFGPTKGIYNPEAMCISTNKEIIVIFRGTDRLVNKDNGPVGGMIYDFGEWILTDFNALPLQSPRENIGGLLHKGMKESTDLVANDIIQFVLDNGGASKPVWITGHSLGGAQAQIISGYLKKRGANVRGVYVFNSCHPGNPAFATALNNIVGKSNIQRFEYLDDPIAMLPPQTSLTTLVSGGPFPFKSPLGGFGRAGERNFYSKLDGANFFANQTERQEGQEDRTNLGRSGKINILSMCFHNPHWICNALYKELSSNTAERMPMAPSLSECEFCLVDAMETGRTGLPIDQRIIEDVGEAVGEVVENLTYNVNNIFENFVGTAIPEGDYYIRCNKGRKYLDISGSCMNENGCKAQLWDLGKSSSNNIFSVKKEGPSYRITLKTNSKSLEVKRENGKDVQIWNTNVIGGANINQKWFFYKVNGGSGKAYLLVNAGTMRVLDADNSRVNSNGGDVNVRKARSNDPTQVWIMEKVN